jgi:hypothetical protein
VVVPSRTVDSSVPIGAALGVRPEIAGQPRGDLLRSAAAAALAAAAAAAAAAAINVVDDAPRRFFEWPAAPPAHISSS